MMRFRVRSSFVFLLVSSLLSVFLLSQHQVGTQNDTGQQHVDQLDFQVSSESAPSNSPFGLHFVELDDGIEEALVKLGFDAVVVQRETAKCHNRLVYRVRSLLYYLENAWPLLKLREDVEHMLKKVVGHLQPLAKHPAAPHYLLFVTVFCRRSDFEMRKLWREQLTHRYIHNNSSLANQVLLKFVVGYRGCPSQMEQGPGCVGDPPYLTIDTPHLLNITQQNVESFPDWKLRDILKQRNATAPLGETRLELLAALQPLQPFVYRDFMAEEQHNLLQEASTYSDLVLLDMVDTYRNLPHKRKALHVWQSLNQEFTYDYTMKTDVDSFLNLELLVIYLKEKIKPTYGTRSVWLGAFEQSSPVHASGKWKDWYPSKNYPPWARGAGNIITYDLVEFIARNRDDFVEFQGEDVSLGIWLVTKNVTRVQNSMMRVNNKCNPQMFSMDEVKNPKTIIQMHTNYATCGNPCSCSVLCKNCTWSPTNLGVTTTPHIPGNTSIQDNLLHLLNRFPQKLSVWPTDVTLLNLLFQVENLRIEGASCSHLEYHLGVMAHQWNSAKINGFKLKSSFTTCDTGSPLGYTYTTTVKGCNATVNLYLFFSKPDSDYVWHHVDQAATTSCSLSPRYGFTKFNLIQLPTKTTEASMQRALLVPDDSYTYLAEQFGYELLQGKNASSILTRKNAIQECGDLSLIEQKQLNDPSLTLRENVQLSKAALQSLRIPFFISHGTLLGWKRECRILPTTTDSDFGIMSEYFSENIVPKMIEAGFTKSHEFGTAALGKEYSFKRKGAKQDFFFCYQEKDILWMSLWNRNMLKKLWYPQTDFGMADLEGILVPIPIKGEEWLEVNYGKADWKDSTKGKNWDWWNSPNNVWEVVKVEKL